MNLKLFSPSLSAYFFKSLLLFVLSVWVLTHSPQLVVNAQHPLQFYNNDTQVRRISFNQREDDPTFEADVLKDQIVTRAPTFWNRFDRINPFRRVRRYPFDPVELQKDVVRLREFYKRNGFPSPEIRYSSSQLDTSSNKIHIILTIREGEPLFIEGIRYLSPDTTNFQAPSQIDSQWRRFVSTLDRSIGERYTEVERIRIQDQLYAWFQNHGYAFAQIDAVPQTDTTRRAVQLNMFIATGPLGYISRIDIEGNQSVSDKILLRELPFRVGDLYSSKELREGQQELFGLNLFRVALTDLPPQLADSTVDVRVRVNEAKRRYITVETGYARQDGIGFEGEWVNRNFFGSARNLSINFIAHTGILGSIRGVNAENAIGKLPARLFRTTVSLKQPYLFSSKLSGIVSPFIEFQNDPQLAASNDFLDINRREFGSNATIIYEALPFRPVSIQYTFSRLLNRSADTQKTGSLARDLYSKSTFGFSATFGKTDNYLSPGKGLLIKPFFETAGRFFPSGLQYNKTGIEFTGYLPLTRRMNLSSRLFIGKLWTFGESKEALAGRSCSLTIDPAPDDVETQRCLIYENRFDPVFFYAGGGSDVRGWNFQLLGPKIARADTLVANGEVQRDENGNPVFHNFAYERIGGTAKLIGNIELRRRIPGLGPSWQGALFLDFGQISNDGFALKDYQYSMGTGIRYNTFIGVVRADVAFKLNPSTADLTRPEDVFLHRNNISTTPPREKFIRRFGFHLSIGQAF